MKNEENILDIRSTGRRRARKALFNAHEPYVCADCGLTVTEPPKDAPPWFDELWPEEGRVLSMLQADHEDKDLSFNDESGLNWRCPSCHKKRDQQTGKGESTRSEKYF